jgi:hypothetical protein
MMISKFNETISRFLSCFQLGGQNYIDASGNYTLFFCINIKSGSILLWMIAIHSISKV